MPYIDKVSRLKLDHTPTASLQFEKKGELTYVIYKLMKQYVNNMDPSYQSISDAISAGIDAAEEFRRQELNPYEDVKRDIEGGI